MRKALKETLREWSFYAENLFEIFDSDLDIAPSRSFTVSLDQFLCVQKQDSIVDR